MANEDFEDVAAAATADASASCKELGCNYAAQFRGDPESFDPRKQLEFVHELEDLGAFHQRLLLRLS